jgi:hypothetical protein
MRKLLFSVLGLTVLLAILIAAVSAPALAFPTAPVLSSGRSAGPVVRADYYYHHHHYHHRHWDHDHWHYYD